MCCAPGSCPARASRIAPLPAAQKGHISGLLVLAVPELSGFCPVWVPYSATNNFGCMCIHTAVNVWSRVVGFVCSPPPPPLHWQGYQRLPPGRMVLATPAPLQLPALPALLCGPHRVPLALHAGIRNNVIFVLFFFIAR